MAEIAVIGAGVAGLAAASALHGAGHRVVVLEKSRGIGGRLATRRTRDGLTYDHGAAIVHPRPDGFAACLRAAVAAGHAAPWRDGFVGLPGMSGLLAGLLDGLATRFATEVAAIERAGARWRLRWEGGAQEVDAILCTAPAPQTARLCAALPVIAQAAHGARMVPGWTLMAAWETLSEPPAALAFTDGPLQTAHDSGARPGRVPHPARWVAHARADWVADHLEIERDAACATLLPVLAARLGAGTALHAAAHRWRYARVEVPVGMPFVAQDGVAAAGDWLLGPEAGDAHASGVAAARAFIADQAAWRGVVK